MNKSIIFMLALLIATCYSCRKDEVEVDDIVIVTPKGTDVDNDLTIFVTNASQLALEGAEVRVRNTTATTNEYGVATLKGVALDSKGEGVSIAKQGYFSTYKRVLPSSKGKSHLTLTLQEKGQPSGKVSASSGGTVSEAAHNASVTLPADGFVVDGTTDKYNGEVSVYLQYFDPSAPSTALSMPGNLHALDKDGDEVQLGTYGMMQVELVGESGQVLNLAKGSEASITMPIPAELEGNAPGEIPLWSLDEASGLWVEESVAFSNNGFYTGDVQHFSFWNCDVPFPLVNITGSLVDNQGQPLGYQTMVISTQNDVMSAVGGTNANGEFEGKVPAGEELIMSIIGACGDKIFITNLPAMTSDTDLGQIVASDLSSLVSITGQATQCDGSPLENGFGVLKMSSGRQYIVAINDGAINGSVMICEVVTDGQFKVVDLDNLSESDYQSVDVSTGTVDVGTISACNELDEYVRVTIPALDTVYLGSKAVVKDGKLVIETRGLVSSLLLELDSYDVGSTFVEKLTYAERGISSFLCGGIFTECDLTAEILQSGGVGDVVKGNVSGNIINGGIARPISVSFKLKISDVLEKVTGIVWEDENQDGIRDGNEVGIDSVLIIAESLDSSTYSSTSNGGLYEIYVSTQSEYTIRVAGPGEISPQDVGNDDTVDSDFNPLTRTYSDMINMGETHENIDCGMYTPTGSCGIEVNTANCVDGPSSVAVYLPNQPPSVEYTFEVRIGNQPVETYVSMDNPFLIDIPQLTNANIKVFVGGSLLCANDVFTPGYQEMLIASDVITEDCQSEIGTINLNLKFHTKGDAFAVAWSNGATTTNLNGVPSGTYTATITDYNGCEEIHTIDAVFDEGSQISGRMWNDNGAVDNIYDQQDELLRFRAVELVDLNGVSVDSSFTNQAGEFYFDQLYQGEFKVQCILESGETLVLPNQGNDDALDSDVDPATRQTQTIAITSGCTVISEIGIGIKK